MNTKEAGRQAPQLGHAVRKLRAQRGWTLAELGRRTEMSISTLSRVENGKMSLSYDQLAKLSAGFEIDIAQLLSPEMSSERTPSRARRSITRAGEGVTVETHAYSYSFPSADLLNKRFVPIMGEIRARSLEEFGELIRHPGEEFATVVEGAIELHTDEYAPLRLEVGDSIYFDSNMGHAYIAAAPGPCRIFSVCSAPAAELMAATRPAAMSNAESAMHRPKVPSRGQARPGRNAARK